MIIRYISPLSHPLKIPEGWWNNEERITCKICEPWSALEQVACVLILSSWSALYTAISYSFKKAQPIDSSLSLSLSDFLSFLMSRTENCCLTKKRLIDWLYRDFIYKRGRRDEGVERFEPHFTLVLYPHRKYDVCANTGPTPLYYILSLGLQEFHSLFFLFFSLYKSLKLRVNLLLIY